MSRLCMQVYLSLLLCCIFASKVPQAVADKDSRSRPFPMLLHSAYTPYTSDGSALNVTNTVPILAKQAARMGVNTAFICGSMAEFDTMTVSERKELAESWLKHGPENDIYMIINIGTTVVQEAKELARHAQEYGTDAIAAMAPYYNRPNSVDGLLTWLMDIASATPKVPFWYYHLPGTTYVDVSMYELLQKAEERGFEEFYKYGGIKFVSNDFQDFLLASNWVEEDRKNRNCQILFAPEPKLQGFALQYPYAGAVLAEDFYGPTYLRMREKYEKGDGAAAIQEQLWKVVSAEGIFNQYGGAVAKRRTYLKSCGVDMGPSRLPGVEQFDESKWQEFDQALEKIGFWEQEAR